MPKQVPCVIYVQIPAYRDAEISRTLDQLLGKASQPDRLRIVVAWQHGAEEKLGRKYFKSPQVEIIDIPHQHSRGCNWARSILQHQWRGENYSLLIDSHHRFVSGWDRLAIRMYENLKAEGVPKPVLTAYLPSYDPLADPGKRMRSCRKIYLRQHSMGLLTNLTSYEITGWKSLKRPIPAQFVSLHFLFTAGTFNEEVLFDPETYYSGDEVSASLRSYTHGYDFFHPHRILGWHEYKRSNRICHWVDHPEWSQQDAESLQKLKSLFRGKLRGKFGIGATRTIKEYENYIGTRLCVPSAEAN